MSNHSKENNKNITNIPQNIQNPLQKIFETKTPTKPYFTMNGSNKKNVYQELAIIDTQVRLETFSTKQSLNILYIIT